MSKRRAPLLVDRFGHPLQSDPKLTPSSYYTFFESSNRYPNGDMTSMTFYDAAQDTNTLLPASDWKILMNAGRFLFANVGLVRGALLEQASYSFPLEPHYRGADKEWGKLAKKWLYGWKMNADVRGPAYDCYTSARVRLLARKVDGDIARLLTFEKGDDYPKLQFIRAHRIGSRGYGSNNLIEVGRYKGYRCYNGVIVNEQGKPIAYRLLGRDKDGAEDDDIEASALVMAYNPDYSDMCRGMSELVATIPSINEVKRLRGYEMRAQQIQAREALVEKNEDGEAPPGAEVATTAMGDASLTGVTIETLDSGLTRYYKANSGSDLELLRPDRPGPGCQEFEDRIIASAFYGMEWDPNFALLLKDAGGAWARTILQKVNRAICNNQRIEARAELAEDTYALSRAIKLKVIPGPKDGDIFSWDYSGPPRITADSGNDENAKREKYKIGALTLEKWAAEDGEWWEEIREQKEIEARDLLTRAKKLQGEFSDLSLQECISMLEQRNPNGPPPEPSAPEQTKP
jgi:hypothetical protein